MPKTCNINKNHLLDLYFNEYSGKGEAALRKHAGQCPECRDYLSTLAQTDRVLHRWQDQVPHPHTLDFILENLPETLPEPEPAAPNTATVPVAPFLKIVVSIVAILGVLVLFHDKLTRFAFWETVQQWWFVKLFGSLGVSAVLLFLLGTFITLALSPILILESQSRKYKYYFR